MLTKTHADLAAQSALQAASQAEADGDLDRALGYFRALAELEPGNYRWPFEGVRVLRKAGRDGEAGEALRQALRRFPKALSRADVRAMLPEAKPTPERVLNVLGDNCPADAELRRPTIEDDGSADVIVAQGGRRAAVIVFTGLADRLVMPLPVFDRFLAALDLTAIYLRDRRRMGFFGGVASLAADYEGTVAALKAVLAERGVDTVHTLGNSAGGMAAVSYGIDLGAKTVHGFSAPVALVAATKDVDFRTAVFADRLLHGVPESRRDFRARLEAAGTPPSVRLYYGADMPEDVYHATFLEGRPGVTLHPIEGLAGHGALFRVAVTQGLRNLFAEAFGKRD